MKRIKWDVVLTIIISMMSADECFKYKINIYNALELYKNCRKKMKIFGIMNEEDKSHYIQFENIITVN